MKIEKKVETLKKINWLAKIFKQLKQKNYDERRYNSVSQCKKIENKLYLLKSLCLLEMEEKGEIKRLEQTLQENEWGECVLETFSTSNAIFHSVAFDQEVTDKEYLSFITGPTEDLNEINKSVFKNIGKDIKLLENTLGEEYKKIYSIINNPPIFESEMAGGEVDTLEKIQGYIRYEDNNSGNIYIENEKGECTYMFLYHVVFYYKGIKLCLGEIYLKDGYFLREEEGKFSIIEED